jgi:hypothetical protein
MGDAMTARKRMREAFATCGHVPKGICRDCCTRAIRIHAEAVREEAAKVAELDSMFSWIGGSTGSAQGTAMNIAQGIRALKVE